MPEQAQFAHLRDPTATDDDARLLGRDDTVRSTRGRDGSGQCLKRILAARKLNQFDGGKRVPATISAIADAVRWAEEIIEAIDERWPAGT